MEPPGVAVSALVAAMLMAACTSPGASSAPAAGVTGAPTAPVATAPASPNAPPGPTASSLPGLFRLVVDEPVVPRTIVPDRGAILPGAIAEDDGRYHAWVIAFGAMPGIQDLLHLTSPDAVEWTVTPDASLDGLGDGLADPGAMPSSVVRGDGEWVMYYAATPAGQREAADIRRATAASLNGPWTADPETVLEHGPAGAWDAGSLDFPSVLRTDDGWRMLFGGITLVRPEAGSIGLATSPDGKAWTKHDDPATTEAELAASDPVIFPGFCGEHDARAVHQPRLVDLGDRLVAAYAGYSGRLDSLANVSLAQSRDGGATWQCRWPSPALDEAGLPPGGLGVHTMLAFRREDRLALLVEWLAGEGTDIWLAEAATLPE